MMKITQNIPYEFRLKISLDKNLSENDIKSQLGFFNVKFEINNREISAL